MTFGAVNLDYRAGCLHRKVDGLVGIMAKLLSFRKVKAFRVDEIQNGQEIAEELYYAECPYLCEGRVKARRYLDGVGFQERHEIMILSNKNI